MVSVSSNTPSKSSETLGASLTSHLFSNKENLKNEQLDGREAYLEFWIERDGKQRLARESYDESTQGRRHFENCYE
ncbi:hypothetical protein HAX54_033582, partial [Datura stramonium]|nr:hypothetical protein [Datura stramonium]